MPEAIESLWSTGVTTNEPSPISVLRSQVAPIKEMTGGLIEGEVITWSGNDGFLYYLFDVVAPKLSHARRCVVGVSHSETRLYPATVQAEILRKDSGKGKGVPEVGAEASGSWSIQIVRDREGNTDWPQARNGKELKELLSKVFQSEPVANLIQTLIARSLKGEKAAS